MKLKCDEPLSSVAFNLNVRRYNVVEGMHRVLDTRGLHSKGYDNSGKDDEEVEDDEEYSDDEKEAGPATLRSFPGYL